jgi:hypothetical protein
MEYIDLRSDASDTRIRDSVITVDVGDEIYEDGPQ